jgi:hypothetical protein
MTNGLCKIDYTKEEIDSVVAYYKLMGDRLNECNKRIERGDFENIVRRKFLCFSWKSKRFDMAGCEKEFEDLFHWARWWEYDGGHEVWSSTDLDYLCDCVRLLKTAGDVYLPPHYCTVFRRALRMASQEQGK